MFILPLFTFSLVHMASCFHHSREKRDRNGAEVVFDDVAPLLRTESRSSISSGGPVPDWSDVKLRDGPRHIEILLVIDAVVARHYGHDREKIRIGMLAFMHAVNMYVYQLGIRMIIVDVASVHGHNVTLEQFFEWRQNANDLPEHDVAMLIRHRYEGGIAYVNGVCKRSAVGICGFFPEAPFEYASVFVHELAHLLGLSHDKSTKCHCNKRNKANCLRIDGFEHDCSVQALVDLLPQQECLLDAPDFLPNTVLSICGNGVVEIEEDCDCGPTRFCDNVLCDARSCRFIIPHNYLYSIITFGTSVLICFVLLIIKKICSGESTKQLSARKNKMILSLASPRKDMLVYANGVPTNDSLIVKNKKSTSTETAVYPECAIQLPTIPGSLLPIRYAPKRPSVELSLDLPVPIIAEDSNIPGYVRMNPLKELKAEKETTNGKALRLPSITKQRLEISDPIPLVVAGKPVADFISTLEESLRNQSLTIKKQKVTTVNELSTLPRPLIPDKRNKPFICRHASLKDGPYPRKDRLYDLPPLDT